MPKLLKLVCAALLSAASLLVATTAANAHDSLLESYPGSNAVVETSPTEVRLIFSNNIMDVAGANVIYVRDANNEQVATQDPEVNGESLSVTLSAELQTGAYTVVWRAVSSDGHPIEGTFVFGVGDVTDADLQKLSATNTTSAATTETATVDSDSEGAPNGTTVVAASIAVLLFSAIVIAVIVWYTRSTKK